MSQVPLAPPPQTGQPIDGWLFLLWKRLTQAGQVLVSSLTGTKADFDTACTDDDFAFLGQDNTFTGKIGVGTNTTSPSGVTLLNTIFATNSAAGLNSIFQKSISATNGPNCAFLKSRGSISSPSAIVSGDFTGGFGAYGFDGTDYVASNSIQFISEGVVSSGVVPAKTKFLTASSLGVLTDRLILYSSGTVEIPGDIAISKTVTAAGTTGAQTINKTTGTVNFATAAASLIVTNSLVSASSIIICTVGTNDATMKSVQAVAGSGSFTLYPNAVPTAETRVNFLVTN